MAVVLIGFGVGCSGDSSSEEAAQVVEDDSVVREYSPEVNEGTVESELGVVAASEGLIGLAAETIPDLEAVVLATYDSTETALELNVVAEPVSVVDRIVEVTWEITGFADDSVTGERVFAQIIEAEDGGVVIQDILVQPICARGVSEDGLCL